MTRSSLLNLTIIVLLVMTVIAGLLWWQVGVRKVENENLERQLTSLQVELAGLAQIVAQQATLHELTMDERKSSLLDILKYLNLQNMQLDFQIEGRESVSSGDTTLISRGVALRMERDYREALELIDRIHASGKFILRNILLLPGPDTAPGTVAVTVQGRIFSLEKIGEVAP